jgi:hypothetical protein
MILLQPERCVLSYGNMGYGVSTPEIQIQFYRKMKCLKLRILLKCNDGKPTKFRKLPFFEWLPSFHLPPREETGSLQVANSGSLVLRNVSLYSLNLTMLSLSLMLEHLL